MQRTSTRRSSGKTVARNSVGVSHVITTVIISGVLLVILVVASFAATTILESQMQSTQFEEAKSKMMLLNDVVQDVALRVGAGGYASFNQRSGGIGLYNDSQRKIEIVASNSTQTYTLFSSSTSPEPPLSIIYSAGSRTPGSEENLTGRGLPIVNMSQGLGFLRVEHDEGLKIKLDFYRVRIVEMGSFEVGSEAYNYIEVTFLQPVWGEIRSGSDTVNVNAQNIGFRTDTWVFERDDLREQTVTIQVKSGTDTATRSFKGPKTVVVFTEILVKISLV